jgi:hypothetical protein
MGLPSKGMACMGMACLPACQQPISCSFNQQPSDAHHHPINSHGSRPWEANDSMGMQCLLAFDCMGLHGPAWACKPVCMGVSVCHGHEHVNL